MFSSTFWGVGDLPSPPHSTLFRCGAPLLFFWGNSNLKASLGASKKELPPSWTTMKTIVVLHLAICSSGLFAFSPADIIYPIRRSNHALATRADIDNKPYYAKFSTDNVNNNRHLKYANAKPTDNSFNHEIGVGKTAIVAGSTGYIGRACVRECVSRGYSTIALVRDATRARVDEALDGAFLLECDVNNEREVQSLFLDIAIGKIGANEQVKGDAANEGSPSPVDIVISCLASPSGKESEVYAIDYQATLNLLNAGRGPSVRARHFVLLSAFCCRNPILKVSRHTFITLASLDGLAVLTHLRFFCFLLLDDISFNKRN